MVIANHISNGKKLKPVINRLNIIGGSKMFTKRIVVLGAVLFALGLAAQAHSAPLDLSGFSVMENVAGSVTQSGGTISFTENSTDAALYFYNDFFVVPNNATALSFDYSFALGEFDAGDYLQSNIDYVETWYTDLPGSGHVEFDMTAFQGQTIALDWALIWGGDDSAGSIGSISNIDLAVSPVPEPATLLLIGSGLAGLVGLQRKKV